MHINDKLQKRYMYKKFVEIFLTAQNLENGTGTDYSTFLEWKAFSYIYKLND